MGGSRVGDARFCGGLLVFEPRAFCRISSKRALLREGLRDLFFVTPWAYLLADVSTTGGKQSTERDYLGLLALRAVANVFARLAVVDCWQREEVSSCNVSTIDEWNTEEDEWDTDEVNEGNTKVDDDITSSI